MVKINKRNTRAQEIIWNFLLDNAGEKFYLSQIARRTEVSDSTAHQILEKQVNKKLVQKEKLGNLSLYFIDQSDPAIKLKKQTRILSALKDSSLFKLLKDYSQKIILYGSAARGEDSKESDIDLFIVSNEKDQVYKIFSQSKLKNKIKLVVKNFLEWVELKKKDKFFFNEINKGIVLWDKNEAV